MRGKPTYWSIEKLHEWDQNPRSITKGGFARLKGQIQKLGQYKPLLITPDGTVLGGNMRLKAYRELGVDKVWVSVVEPKNENEKMEFSLSDNDRAGFYDDDLLANIMPNYEIDWSQYSVDLKEPANLKDLLDQFQDVSEDDAPEISSEPAISGLGEVYQLGRHRLMCGDATKIEDVQRLMDGKKADIIYTDPPYGIAYHAGEMGLKGSLKFNVLEGDSEEMDLSLLLSYENKCSMVVWGSQNFIKQLPYCGRWICWDKRTNERADMGIGSDFELAWTNKKSGYFKMYRIQHGGYINADDFGKKRLHPTQKPIKLCVQILEDQKAGNNVLDLFGGSGSTLIACEQTNRINFSMEIDPKYTDVIRKRYAKFIGKEDLWQTETPVISR